MLTFDSIVREVGDDPAKWQRLWRSLLQAEAFALGLHITDVSGSDNPSTPDGGRDIVIEAAPKPNSLIPHQCRSIWSVKSGKNAKSPSTLAAELDSEKHPELIARLRDGTFFFYCVCLAIGENERDKLRSKAASLEAQLGLPTSTIYFCFEEHLLQMLQRHIGVLNAFCPQLTTGVGLSVEAWRNSSPITFNASIPFVAFDERTALLDELTNHLRQRSAEPHLHLAGLSGIGKTRLAYEAAIATTRVDLVYFSKPTESQSLLDRLIREPNLSACMIIDECRTEELDELHSKLGGLSDRVRCLTIGPGMGNEESREYIRVLRPPENDEAVIKVISSTLQQSCVNAELLRIVARLSGKDLRYALLLSRLVAMESPTNLQIGQLSISLANPDYVLSRVLSLYQHDLTDPIAFKKAYQWLTLSLDLRWRSPNDEELVFVSELSGIGINALRATITESIRIGLGDSPAHLFEASPRGLANVIFERELWPQLVDRFPSVWKNAPSPAFRRSILQRLELVSPSLRSTSTAIVDGAMHDLLGPARLEALEEPEIGRLFRGWAELSVDRPLAWLQQAIASASSDELRAFADRRSGGGVNSYQQVIWTLEHLSCFDTCFQRCEEMLFRLACFEQSHQYGLAARIWTERQRVMLSNAQTNYTQRRTLLMARLRRADTESVDLLLGGLLSATTQANSVGRPPTLIGGRFVPTEWQPVGIDVYALLVDTIQEALKIMGSWPVHLKQRANAFVIGNLRALYKEDLGAALESFLELSGATEDTRLELAIALEDLLSWLRAHEHNPKEIAVNHVSSWFTRIAPKSGKSFVQFVVSRPTWLYDRSAGNTGDAWQQPYKQAAETIRVNPQILIDLGNWLPSVEPNGPGALGSVLYEQANIAPIRRTIERWIRDSACLDLTRGFAYAARRHLGEIPASIASVLDSLVEEQPEYVARFTSETDPSEAGWIRLWQCLQQADVDVLKALALFQVHGWKDIISPDRLLRLIDRIVPSWEAPSEEGWRQVESWIRTSLGYDTKDRVPLPLRPLVEQLVQHPPQVMHDHFWRFLAARLAAESPEIVWRSATRLAVDPVGKEWEFSEQALRLLADLRMTFASDVETCVLQAISAQTQWRSLEIEEWQSFIAMFELASVQAFSERASNQFVLNLGRLVPDPSVDDTGQVALHPLTEWYLTIHAPDERCYQAFLEGRWDARWRHGWAWDGQARIDRLFKVYSTHKIPALRRWSQDLVVKHRANLLFDRTRYEELYSRD